MRKSPAVILASLLLLLFALPASALAAEPPKLTVLYFYSNACGSCNAGGELYDEFNRIVGSAADGVDVDVLMYNTFQTQDDIKFRDACEQYGIPREERALPLVVVGGVWLSGKQAIGERLREVFLAEKARALSKAGDTHASTLLYFYISPCEECEAVKEFMDGLEGSYAVASGGGTIESPLAVASWNVAEAEGLALVKELFGKYGVPDARQKAPIVFFREGYLSGEEEITGQLIERIREGGALGTEVPGAAPEPAALTAWEWPGIFLTGLVNGLNPCSVSLLLFLIALLLARNANVLKMGFSFIAGKTVAYLALGTVLFGALLAIDGAVLKLFQDAVKVVLLVVVLAAAAMNVSDFVAAKNEKYNGIRMQLPVRLRRFNHNWIKKMTEGANARLLALAAFALGLLISVGEFLCTGQIYLATILYMIRRSPALDLRTLGALAVYVAGMMTPLILLTAAVWKGRAVFNLTELARKHMPAVKLATATVFLAFGAILFFFM